MVLCSTFSFVSRTASDFFSGWREKREREREDLGGGGKRGKKGRRDDIFPHCIFSFRGGWRGGGDKVECLSFFVLLFL